MTGTCVRGTALFSGSNTMKINVYILTIPLIEPELAQL